jgi:hypothetical protein
MRCFYQIRNNNRPVDQRLYSSLHEASSVLVRKYGSPCEVIELDNPAGAVIRRFTFVECEKILGTAREPSSVDRVF